MSWTLDEPTDQQDQMWTVEEPEEEDTRPKSQFAAGYFTPEEQPIRGFAQNLQELEEFKQGIMGGATAGLTKLLPGLPEVETNVPGVYVSRESPYYQSGEFLGSFLPVDRLLNFFGGSLKHVAQKSPILKNQLSSLANLTGSAITGAVVGAEQKLGKGEMPTAEDMMEHGMEWATIDAALQALGLGGRFAAALVSKAKAAKTPAHELLNKTISELKAEGIPFDNPERVTARALEILEKPQVPATRQIAGQGKVQESALGKEIPVPENFQARQQASLDLLNRNIAPRQFRILQEGAPARSEPFEPNQMNAEKIAEDLDKTTTNELMDIVSPREESEQILGQNIKRDIQKEFEAAEETYKPLYKSIDEEIAGVTHSPENSINLAKKLVEEINALKTKPEGYQKIINNLNTALEDMGYTVQEFENKIVLQSSPGFQLKNLELMEQVPLRKTMELGRRLNKIIDYDLIGPSIKNKLKPLAKSVKNETKDVLAQMDPKLAEVFELAEKRYGETAQRFGKDSVIKMRGEESAEKLADLIKHPSNLENVRAVVSPAQFQKIERELLEHINGLNHKQAKDFLREIKDHLTEDARGLAESLVKEKAPMSPLQKARKVQKNIIDDLSNSVADGTRPEKTLDLWKTVKGQRLIRDALRKSPNRRQITDYLQNQSFYDFTKSFISPEGAINFEKFNELMRDPAVLENVRLIGGDQAVQFFRHLENTSNQLNRNRMLVERMPFSGKTGAEEVKKIGRIKNHILERAKTRVQTRRDIGKNNKQRLEQIGKSLEQPAPLGKEKLKRFAEKEKPQPFWFESYLDQFGTTGKVTLGVLLGMKLGVFKSAEVLALGKGLLAAAKNKKVRQAFEKAKNSPRNNPVPFLQSIDYLGDIFDEEEEY